MEGGREKEEIQSSCRLSCLPLSSRKESKENVPPGSCLAEADRGNFPEGREGRSQTEESALTGPWSIRQEKRALNNIHSA